MSEIDAISQTTLSECIAIWLCDRLSLECFHFGDSMKDCFCEMFTYVSTYIYVRTIFIDGDGDRAIVNMIVIDQTRLCYR